MKRIFVTVGGQMSFDRMIRAVDAWAATHDHVEVFAQIGASDFEPQHMPWTQFLPPDEYREHVHRADAIVSHAGMGSILTALETRTPILVLPRRGDLQETRNDHQVATARRFHDSGKIDVAYDEHELVGKLDTIGTSPASSGISPYASEALIQNLREFIHAPNPTKTV